MSGTTIVAGAPVTLIAQPNGFFTAIRKDGTVDSVQPDGSLQTRPAGTAGAYELCAVTGNTRWYCPDGSHVYGLPYAGTVPNV